MMKGAGPSTSLERIISFLGTTCVSLFVAVAFGRSFVAKHNNSATLIGTKYDDTKQGGQTLLK